MATFSENIKEKLEGFSANVPSAPEILVRVREISDNPQSSAADLANIILSDHNLTSRILKLANSAYYGEFSGKVATVTQAILLMGFRTVRNIVVSISIHDTFTNSAKFGEFNFRRFWTKSVGCGVLGKDIARACGMKIPEEAFIAGFIHDIGKLVMCQIFPEEYPKIEKLIEGGEPEIEAERSLIGTDHCALGAWLARNWNLPIQIIEPISAHHRDGLTPGARSKSKLVDVVYIAQRCFKEVDMKNDSLEGADDLLKEADILLNLSEEKLSRIADRAWQQISDVAVDLGIRLERKCDTGVMASDEIEDALRLIESETKPEQNDGATPDEKVIKELQEVAEQLSRRERELSVMQEASEGIRVAASTDEALQTVLESIYRGMDLGRVVLLDISADVAEARGRLGFGVESQGQVQDMLIELHETKGVIANARRNRRVYNILDAASNAFSNVIDPAEVQKIGANAFAVLPLEIDGTINMVILLNNKDPNTPIDDDSLKSAQALIAQAEMAVEKQILQEKLLQARGDEVNSLLDTAFT